MHIITGGAGFVGSHLVDALVARGEEVKIVDNFSRGSMANVTDAMKTGLLTISKLDLENYGLPMRSDDIVWHLAAKVAGIEQNRKGQYEMLRANLNINYNVIESVRKNRPKLFVYASTACVYPGDAPVPTPESAGAICNPEPTNHGYGVAKWVGEQMVRHLNIEHNQECVIVRFFNVIGKRDYYDESAHVVPALIRRVMEGENPVNVWGSGRQTRVFVDARDIATALLKLYDYMMLNPESELPIVNIGHEQEVSIAELIQAIVGLCGKDVGYQFDTSKPDGHARRAADVTRLRSIIGWVPDMSLEDSIADMIEDWKQNHA